jgi:hypothetical protein
VRSVRSARRFGRWFGCWSWGPGVGPDVNIVRGCPGRCAGSKDRSETSLRRDAVLSRCGAVAFGPVEFGLAEFRPARRPGRCPGRGDAGAIRSAPRLWPAAVRFRSVRSARCARAGTPRSVHGRRRPGRPLWAVDAGWRRRRGFGSSVIAGSHPGAVSRSSWGGSMRHRAGATPAQRESGDGAGGRRTQAGAIRPETTTGAASPHRPGRCRRTRPAGEDVAAVDRQAMVQPMTGIPCEICSR